MQKIYIILFINLATICFAQVGIGTESPEAKLDVNGDMRVRQSPQTDNADFVLSSDADGFIRQIPIESIKTGGAVNLESAVFVPGSNTSVNGRVPTLDLWTEQKDQGLESIKRYYFLGQNVSVTLPHNISVLGDKTARVITFVVVDNNEFGGENLSNWNVAFQTKLFQENTDSFQGSNAGVYLYENTFAGSDLGNSSSVITEGSSAGYRRRINMDSQGSIRDREINFYDFGGKWIMTVND